MKLASLLVWKSGLRMLSRSRFSLAECCDTHDASIFFVLSDKTNNKSSRGIYLVLIRSAISSERRFGNGGYAITALTDDDSGLGNELRDTGRSLFTVVAVSVVVVIVVVYNLT